MMGLQSTIDSPDSVRRVTPPNTTMIKIITQQVSSHNPIAVLLSRLLDVGETDIDLFPPIRVAVGVRDHGLVPPPVPKRKFG